MNTQAKIEAPKLALLREPFGANHISKLPKETRSQIDARKANKNLMVWNCQLCGGHHHKDAVHLDYVGHAALTDRLLDTDPEWSWEPVAFGADGLPATDRNGGLWIRLTVLGVTRLGYGDADGKTGGNAVKEAIGDALRNAAMRFGAALDLWHKGDLHGDEGADEHEAPAPEAKRASTMPDHIRVELVQLVEATKTSIPKMFEALKIQARDLRDLTPEQVATVKDRLTTKLSRMAKEETDRQTQARQLSTGELIDDEIPY